MPRRRLTVADVLAEKPEKLIPRNPAPRPKIVVPKRGVERVRWRTVNDGRVCPLCDPLNGKLMSLARGKELLPRHHNCRCELEVLPSLVELRSDMELLVLASALEQFAPRSRVERIRGGRFDGAVVMRDVPLISESHPGHHDLHPAQAFFDGVSPAWLAAALVNHAQKAREGYLAPLIVGHHEPGRRPERVGFIAPSRLARVTLDGAEVVTLMADLILDTPAAEAVSAGRYPYLSVEVHPRSFPVGTASIFAVALLDDEPPEYRYPLLGGSALARDGSVCHDQPACGSARAIPRRTEDAMPQTVNLSAAAELAKHLGLTDTADRLAAASAQAQQPADVPADEGATLDGIMALLSEFRAALQALDARIAALETPAEPTEEAPPMETEMPTAKSAPKTTTNTEAAPASAKSSETASGAEARLAAMVQAQEARIAQLEAERAAAQKAAQTEQLVTAAAAELTDAGLRREEFEPAVRAAAANSKATVDAVVASLKTVAQVRARSIETPDAWDLAAGAANARVAAEGSAAAGDARATVEKYRTSGRLAQAQSAFREWESRYQKLGISAQSYVDARMRASEVNGSLK